jgi:hypothetical protein
MHGFSSFAQVFEDRETQVNDTTNELLPCPFCRSVNIQVHAYGTNLDGEPDAFCQCHACSTTGPNGKNEAEAIAAWDRRANARELTEEMQQAITQADEQWISVCVLACGDNENSAADAVHYALQFVYDNRPGSIIAWNDPTPVLASVRLRDASVKTDEPHSQKGDLCGLSWDGKNISGDVSSIKAVKAALHDAALVPELKEIIAALSPSQKGVDSQAVAPVEPIYFVRVRNSGDMAWVEHGREYAELAEREYPDQYEVRRLYAAPSTPAVNGQDAHSLIASFPRPEGCPRPHGDCSCSCHSMPGVKHIMPCCYPTSDETADPLQELVDQAQELDMGYGPHACPTCGKSQPVDAQAPATSAGDLADGLMSRDEIMQWMRDESGFPVTSGNAVYLEKFMRRVLAMRPAATSTPSQPSDAQADARDAVRDAILEYYAALDNRQHGGVAQDRAFNKIQQALGMHWVQGASKTKEQQT